MALPFEILFAFLMTAVGSFGALCFKYVTNRGERLNVKGLLSNKMLYLGGFLYVLASLFNVILLRYLDYSIVYPLSALTYIWTLFISRFILHEKINAFKITAVVLIIVGIIVVNA